MRIVLTLKQTHKNRKTTDRQYGDWYTGPCWVVCYIWYSEKGRGRAPRCTKCHSPPIEGQCTNFILFDVALSLPLPSKRVKE